MFADPLLHRYASSDEEEKTKKVEVVVVSTPHSPVSLDHARSSFNKPLISSDDDTHSYHRRVPPHHSSSFSSLDSSHYSLPGRDGWAQLPPPLLGLCLSHLLLRDLLTVRQTCRSWRRGRAERVISLSSLHPFTVSVHPYTVDALPSLARAVAGIAPLTDLTLTETEHSEEELHLTSRSGHRSLLTHRVAHGFPPRWSLNDAVQQLITVRRQRPPSERWQWPFTSRRAAGSSVPQRKGESQRRSFPLTKLTLRHRAERVPLTMASMSALCFLLPTLQELHIVSDRAPPELQATGFFYRRELSIVLRPIGQLQLRVLSLPPWTSLDGFRAIFDAGAHFENGCRAADESMWTELSTVPFPLTPCGLSLTSLTIRGFEYRSFSNEAMALCVLLPQLTALALVDLFLLRSVVGRLVGMPRLTSLQLTNSVPQSDLTASLSHLSALTSLDLGCSALGADGLHEVDHLVRCCPRLQSLAGVTLWENVIPALRPLEGLSRLGIICRAVADNDERPRRRRPFPCAVRVEMKLLPQLSALTSLCVHYLPSNALTELLTCPLPALQALEVHLDYLTYLHDFQEPNCRGVAEPDGPVALEHFVFSDDEAGYAFLQKPMERSIVDASYVTHFSRLRMLPSLTRLHFGAPRLNPRIIHVITFLPALQQLTLEVDRPKKWEAANPAKTEEIAQLHADPLRCLQDVDLLHLAALPALHRLELRNIAQLTAMVLPVLACLDALRELVMVDCAGIDAGEVAELAGVEHSVDQSIFREQHRPPRLGQQQLDVVHLEGCVRLPSSCRSRLRQQLGAWSALKLSSPELLLISAPTTVRSSPAAEAQVSTLVPFTLETRQWRLGVIPGHLPPAHPAVVDSKLSIVIPVAYISHSHQPSHAPPPFPSRPTSAAMADHWSPEQRHPGVLGMVGLYLQLMWEGLLVLWGASCPYSLMGLMKRSVVLGLLAFSLLFVFWPVVPGLLIGLLVEGRLSNVAWAWIITAVLWPPQYHIFNNFAKKRRLMRRFNRESRLAKRRLRVDGTVDVDGMDEGGWLAGWTAGTLSTAFCSYSLSIAGSVLPFYNFANLGLYMSGRRDPDSGDGGGAGTLFSSSTGLAF